MVLRRCRYMLKDVFVKVLEKEKKLHSGAPSSLLYTMATNHCLNIIRDTRDISTPDEIMEAVPSSEGNMEERIADNLLLEEIFRQEKPNTRLIAFLHYIDRLTLEETAEFVGMSVSGVRKRLRRLKETGLKLKGEAYE